MRLLLKVSAAIVLSLLFAQSARAQQACTQIQGSPIWCDQTLTITTATTIQNNVGSIPSNAGSGGNRARQYIQFQNNSATAAITCALCFGAAARGQACSAANAGTYLGQGQSFARSNQQQYGGIQINSLYFNSDISVVNIGGTCVLSVSIDG